MGNYSDGVDVINANMTHQFNDLNTSQAATEPQEYFMQPTSSPSSVPITSVRSRASRAAPMRQQERYAEAASPSWQSENKKRCKRNKRVSGAAFKRIFAWQGPNTSQCRKISPKNLSDLHSWTQVKMRNYLGFYGILADPASRLDDLRDRIVKVLTTAT